jgi:hypothetical protein
MKKSIIKYRHDSEEGYMHYIVFEEKFVVLSQFKSNKVDYINEHGKIEITFDLKSDTFDPVKAEVVTDSSFIHKVMNEMQRFENSYYREYEEGLCAIIIHK